MPTDPVMHAPEPTPHAERPAYPWRPGSAWTEAEPPNEIDGPLQALLGHYTMGVSPAALSLAFTDWAVHLAISPGKWWRLIQKALRKELKLARFASQAALGGDSAPCIEPLPQDRRFNGDAWRRWPFNLIYQSFLLHQQWWFNATTDIGGVSPHHENVVSFAARQLLDMVAPTNFVATNPEVLYATLHERGENLVRGAAFLLEDLRRAATGGAADAAHAFVPGREVAATEGTVVFRNHLIELIQYEAKTPHVAAEPILIVPAWIMKYYILDLSPHNSLVAYLVERGYTVFMVSWRNPDKKDAGLGMIDYLRLGPLAAIDAIRGMFPGRDIHAAGYCLGGTLLSIAAAYLCTCGASPLRTVTLLAAQTDFREAGELSLFVDDSELDFLDKLMQSQGFLDNRQMAGAFQLLRSHDLIWSRAVKQYLLGERTVHSDLTAWNADATRMPARMHSEYLRQLFLNNDLFEGRFRVDGKPVALSDIRAPLFVVATEHDHVAPWRSVYKIHLLADTDVSFLLTSGGHNAGIVSEPGHAGRHYRLGRRQHGSRYLDPDSWFETARLSQGSWWPAWEKWLRSHTSGRVPAPATGGKPVPPGLCPAPGTYVFT